MTAAAIYTRTAVDDPTGIEWQLAECRALVERQGLALVAEFVDNGLAAWSPSKRPGYLALVEAVRAGQVGTIVVYRTDRLTRDPGELADLVAILAEHSVDVVTVKARR